MSENAWIEHDGGECPTAIMLKDIEVETKDGARYEGAAIAFMRGRWEHSRYLPEGDHIIAYRLSGPSA